jgi:NAD(P)-dependent dehydrogenase (short-subunit alcohol dehydrogenase family)
MARSRRDLEEVAREIRSASREVLALPCDLAHEVKTTDAVLRAHEAFGHVDILVNAAGTDIPGPVSDLSPRDWDRVLAVNLRAPFLLARAVFPGMAQRGKGTIINISSVAGKRGWANAAAYCASKFGLTGFTQALAAEGKPHGIRACTVYPGAMATSWGIWSTAAATESQARRVRFGRGALMSQRSQGRLLDSTARIMRERRVGQALPAPLGSAATADAYGLSSVSVCSALPKPTAHTWPEVGSADSARSLPPGGLAPELGLGLGTTLQLLPFHCSISVVGKPLMGS